MSVHPRSRSWLVAMATVLFLAPLLTITATGPASGAATVATTDAGASQRLRDAFDDARTAAGLGPYFTRTNFQSAAVQDALLLAAGGDVTTGPDQGTGLPTVSLVTPDALSGRISNMIRNLAAVNQLPDFTDGGWSVATKVIDADTIRIGMMVWIGVPQSPMPRTGGCTDTGGYCWRSFGLNPHVPWIRNRLRWYVSTSGLTSYRLTAVRRAVAMVNAVPGLGLDVALGGTTAAVAPTAARRFVLRWMTTGQACGSTVPLGCNRPDGATGTYSSALIQMRSNGMANSAGRLDDWSAVVAHEVLHSLGLDHYDRVYARHFQLMRSVAGELAPRAGDRHGMVRIAPPGRLSATLKLPPGPLAAGQVVDAAVTTASTGFGGIRSVVVECTDPGGVPRPVASRSGLWDIIPTVRQTPWTVPITQTQPYTSSCHAVVRSKAASVTSSSVTVQVGGPAA